MAGRRACTARTAEVGSGLSYGRLRVQVSHEKVMRLSLVVAVECVICDRACQFENHEIISRRTSGPSASTAAHAPASTCHMRKVMTM